jgi:hypothetical protein
MRGAAEDSEFLASRLRAGQAALQPLLSAAQDRERAAQWHRDADAMELLVKNLHDDLVPMVRRAEAAELEFDSACDAIDDISLKIFTYMKKCDEIEAAAPPGEARRLPRPIAGLSLARYMARKVAPVVPVATKAEVVDYSLSFRPWLPDPDAPVLTYEERLAAHEKQIADENEQRARMYAERAAANSQRELENQRRALAESQRRRDIENFGEAAQ